VPSLYLYRIAASAAHPAVVLLDWHGVTPTMLRKLAMLNVTRNAPAAC